ncbi:His Kinase A (phospho-acceptor) domain-containing protein [Noviherbaspirillum humi]|uniref:histidine kinase n=1 Tax=Noviherbaspirillum humi TaxID=1688639 RepID=A0A239IE91_9BURK|nr:ATP-binding protein [Noviherbaspirillum humi]SNS91568.1 His Kinase A (phospho-acceptor) domain-containing protein [Noviherbaspirillum humi]
MMRSIRRSISRKLMLVVLATTFMALLVSALAMLAYDIRDYRRSWVNDLTTQANILAGVSLPALEFNDPRVARENLEQLKARPGILAAAIYNQDGELFASYVADRSAGLVPRLPDPPGSTIDIDQILVYQAIQANGEKFGTIYLQGRYDLLGRIGTYLAILAVVMAASLMVAALVAGWLQAAITQPILSVADIARRVVEKRDFSLRVAKPTEDEIGMLVDAFNSMLSEVGQRTAELRRSNDALILEMGERRHAEEALRQLNDTLEHRIAARTAELETAHEQLRQAQKMEAVGQLTGGIAHDFNNLLAGIVANLEMMQVRIAQGRTGDIGRYVDSAMSSADRAASLTHRLLAFSRRQALDPKPTSINTLVRSMEDLIRRSVGPAVQVTTDLAPDLWNTMCDPHQLENALLNLAINARDAMPHGGRLHIESRNTTQDNADGKTGSRDYVAISVSDSGVGMAPEVLARAFDPFFTTKPLGQGTGLGLSMVYGFVNQSGGFIRIQSEPREGTTVWLYMPRHAGSEEAQQALKPSSEGLHPARARHAVLVVDDEAPIRQMAAEMLEELGYEVLEAGDGPQALPLLQSGRRIDLLVTDIGLPNGMNGRQLAEAARGLRPGLKVLLITGYAQAGALDEGRFDADTSLLTKPFRLDAFAARIAAMLEGVPQA